MRAEATADNDAATAAGTQPSDDVSFTAKSGWLSVHTEKGKSEMKLEPAKIKLFCFAWTSGSPNEKKVMPEILKQFAKCDGHAIFGDKDSPGPHDGITLVNVPSQKMAPPTRQFRNDSKWMYHRNMAGIIPGWGHLIQNHMLDDYDWVINSEFDHFMRPTEVRKTIAEYYQNMWSGTKEEKGNVGKPLMLAWGNAFLFNGQMVKEMGRQWSLLGKQMPESHHASGCPDWMGPKHPWVVDDCPQDDTYPMMANIMDPPVKMYGQSGCGQPCKNGLGKDFNKGGLTCYQMDQSPLGGDGSLFVQLASLRAIASDKVKRGNSNAANGRSLLQSGEHADAEKASVQRHGADEVGTGAADVVGGGASGEGGQGGSSEESSHAEQDTLSLDGELHAKVQSLQSMVQELESDGDSAKSRRVAALLKSLQSKYEGQQDAARWFTFWPEKTVPIFHNVKHVEAMALGRELLGL